MKVKLKLSLVLLAALNAALAARADIKLHRVFTDHMVLQRDMNVNVWGWADPGEKVSVQFGGQNLSAIANDKGKWSVKFAGRAIAETGRGCNGAQGCRENSRPARLPR